MRFPTIDHFITGVVAPVSCLRTQQSCGVGEFADIVALGRWCERTGIDLIQILPVNDTGDDASPYNAQSAFALNPIYIRLEDIPGYEVCSDDIEIARRRFEGFARLQYKPVRRFKMEMLRRIFEHIRDAVYVDPAFQKWMEENRWLHSYVRFMGGTADLFIAWVQYRLDAQLREAAMKVDAMGITLKGDIPILLSADSADVQFNPSLFSTALRVGAPPDMFSREGQNWHFPSFRWSEMERDHFAWWRDRLQRASRFYHAFRIDHVLGFFRIWLIPEGEQSAALGYFDPARRISASDLDDAGFSEAEIASLVESHTLIRAEAGFAVAWYYRETAVYRDLDPGKRSRLQILIERYWKEQEPLWRVHGRKLLDAIAKSTDMLVCGEDLGVIPICVPEVLEETGILGLRVERWSSQEGRPMAAQEFPRLTVNTTSTHDSSTLRGWWEEKVWDRNKYFDLLNIPGNCPDYLTTEVCAAIIERTLQSNSLMAILPLQDFFALHYDLRTLSPAEERINVPGLQNEENWTYRMKFSIEALYAYDAYNDYLASIIAARRSKSLNADARVASQSG